MKDWHKSVSLLEATRFAIRGILIAATRERNVRIQILLGTLVVCILIFLHAHVWDIAVVLLAIVLVVGLEMMNTCIELLADALHPEYSAAIRDVKDVAAGAVLLTSIVAGIIGLLIFFSTIQTYAL